MTSARPSVDGPTVTRQSGYRVRRAWPLAFGSMAGAPAPATMDRVLAVAATAFRARHIQHTDRSARMQPSDPTSLSQWIRRHGGMALAAVVLAGASYFVNGC